LDGVVTCVAALVKVFTRIDPRVVALLVGRSGNTDTTTSIATFSSGHVIDHGIGIDAHPYGFTAADHVDELLSIAAAAL
jgi:hypothetical protein